MTLNLSHRVGYLKQIRIHQKGNCECSRRSNFRL